jgi:hypothetical protein
VREGQYAVEEVCYAPNLPGSQARDIPERMPAHYRAVFYLFGQASASPFYAIHDEDTLEFIYNLQTGRGNRPERVLSEVRDRNLLLIGCNFADWLSRFFIRFANSARLASSDRQKNEFLVEEQVASERSLTLFLERFSQNTRMFPGPAQEFLAELARRWDERHPAAPGATADGGLVHDLPDTSPAPADVFISYTRADLSAARALYRELEGLGAGVAWFDKSAIQPGAKWEEQTLGAVRRCAFFLALVSAETEARQEGYFRTEWFEAAERARSIQGRRFIFPVVIDPAYDDNASRYKLVPDRFREYQFAHAPGGRMSDALRAQLVQALRELRRQRQP